MNKITIPSKNELEFVLFCIDYVARKLNSSPDEVYLKLKESGILQSYIIAHYGVLHTLGKDYLVEDIIRRMEEKEGLCFSIPFQIGGYTMKAHPVLLQRKYTRIIALFAQELEISLAEALDKFMFSRTYRLMREGIGDSHCLSDGYLVEDLMREYRK